MTDLATATTRSTVTASAPHPSTREEIMSRAEIRRIAQTLETFGPMRRDSLARACGARHWHPGEFSRALRAGAREGTLRELSFGFVAAAQERPRGPSTETRRTTAPAAHDGAPKRITAAEDPPLTPASPSPGITAPTADSGPSSGPRGPEHAALPEGVSQAMPVAFMLLAIAVPVGLLALSTLGDAALTVGLAVAAMVLIAIVLVRTVNALTAAPTREHPSAEEGRHGHSHRLRL